MGSIVTATYHLWPFGNRGLYITHHNFEHVGQWVAHIDIEGDNGISDSVQLFFEVNRSTSAPPIGANALQSHNKTIYDVASLEELTTGSLRDSDLYQVKIAEAVNNGMATVLVFSSPAFCFNAVCGPQVEVLSDLKNVYLNKANFVHVDYYDNPHEIQGDLSTARISPIVLEWQLPSIEWTFVIDSQGIIIERFEGFVNYDELDRSLRKLF
jgi:hypothetical protein